MSTKRRHNGNDRIGIATTGARLSVDIGYFLKLMNEKNASDLFLSTGAPINIKISGVLTPLGTAAMPAGLAKRIAY